MIRPVALALLGSATLLSGSPTAASEACPVQPRPGLLDAVRPVESAFVTREVSFSGSPSLQNPDTGWVVRVYSETAFEGSQREREKLQVIRLHGEHDCNRWFVTGRWESELEPGQVVEVIAGARPFLAPAAAALSGTGGYAAQDLTLDGTRIEVEIRGPDWRLRRRGNVYAGTGNEVSSLFLSLAARVVPLDEMPTPEWR